MGEMKRIDVMNKAMEQLRLQTSEFENDFGSEDEIDEAEKEMDIEEDIDDDEDIELDLSSEDNLYCAKEDDKDDDIKNKKNNDERITNDYNLESVSDIIINAKTETIDFVL